MHELIVPDASQDTAPLLLRWTDAQGLYFSDHLRLLLPQQSLSFRLISWIDVQGMMGMLVKTHITSSYSLIVDSLHLFCAVMEAGREIRGAVIDASLQTVRPFVFGSAPLLDFRERTAVLEGFR